MKNVPFVKMMGLGNDFVMIDNRDKSILINSELVQSICVRQYGVGSDGVIVLENSQEADFKISIYNEDGSCAQMCGNGLRCAIEFARSLEMINKQAIIETDAGIFKGEILDTAIRVEMIEPHSGEMNIALQVPVDQKIEAHFINTGVPHLVIFSDNVDGIDIDKLGRFLRFHEKFSPDGTNVDFVQLMGNNCLKVRTYESGVVGETQACGTGATAAAVIAHRLHHVNQPVEVLFKGGKLTIDILDDDKIFMTGPVRTVYVGAFKMEE